MPQNNKPVTAKEIISERDQIYKQLFSTDAGKRVLDDLKASLQYSKTLYFNKQTSEELHFQMGRQAVINEIMFILNKDNNKG